MATAGTIQVRVAAEVSSFARDMQRATGEVNRFARSTKDIGQGLRTFGSATGMAAAQLQTLALTLPATSTGARHLQASVADLAGTVSTSVMVMGSAVLMGGQLTKAYGAVAAAGKLMIATPLGLAATGVAALATAVGGLYLAMRDVEKVDWKKPMELLERADDLAAFRRDLALAAQPTVGTLGRSRAAITTTAGVMTPLERADVALAQWKDAVVQIRPITSQIADDWATAMQTINAALSNTTLLTRSEVTELFRMRAALKEIQQVALPAAGAINVGGLHPSRVTTSSSRTRLDPAQVLGDKFKNPLAGLDLSILKQPGLVDKGMEKLLKIGVGSITSMLTGGISSLVGGAIGGLFGSLFGGRRRRAEDRAADAMARLARETERVSEAISNIPTGVKLAGYRFAATDADVGGARSSTRAGDSRWIVLNFNGDMNVSAQNVQEFIAQMSAAAENTVSRGGVSGFRLAAVRSGRGF